MPLFTFSMGDENRKNICDFFFVRVFAIQSELNNGRLPFACDANAKEAENCVPKKTYPKSC